MVLCTPIAMRLAICNEVLRALVLEGTRVDGRKPDEIRYVNAVPYVKQDVFESLDPKTGRPTYAEGKKPGTGKLADFCPSLWGGKDWPYEAYDPNTGLMFVPANDNHCMAIEGKVMMKLFKR